MYLTWNNLIYFIPTCMDLMAVFVFLKIFCQVNICYNEKNFLAIVFGNTNFDFYSRCFGKNFWSILEEITWSLYSIWRKHLETSYRAPGAFFPFGLSFTFTVWSGFFLDKALLRGLNLYQSLTEFSVKRADFYPKII